MARPATKPGLFASLDWLLAFAAGVGLVYVALAAVVYALARGDVGGWVFAGVFLALALGLWKVAWR